MTSRTYNALFLCTGNSARSILAEAILNRVGKGRIRAYSAGSDPKGQVHPVALEVLREHEHDGSALCSKSWDEFAEDGAPVLDFIFTVCDNAAGEACPIWPGKPMTSHWGVPDPAAFEGSETEMLWLFRRTYLELERRIDLFTNLPIDSLDRMSLQTELNDIGKAETSAGENTK